MTDELMFLTLESPELSVRLTNWGARLLSVCYQGVDCLYGPKTEEELRAKIAAGEITDGFTLSALTLLACGEDR